MTLARLATSIYNRHLIAQGYGTATYEYDLHAIVCNPLPCIAACLLSAPLHTPRRLDYCCCTLITFGFDARARGGATRQHLLARAAARVRRLAEHRRAGRGVGAALRRRRARARHATA